MAIKAIVELQAKPGQRAVLKSLLESVAATLGQGEPGLHAAAAGFDVFVASFFSRPQVMTSDSSCRSTGAAARF